MGFDLFLELRLQINELSGLPDLGWHLDASGVAYRIPYVAEEYVVPEKYRKWAKLRGRHLHMYISTFMPEEDNCDASTFYLEMPPWSTIEQTAASHEWTLEQHTEFVEAMSWFASRPGFYVAWSY